MKKIKSLLFILILLVLPGFISAGPIIFESYLETADMGSKNSMHETIEIFVDFNETQGHLNLSLVPGIENLKGYLDDKEIECKSFTKIGKSDVVCFFDKDISGKHFLKIEFDSSYSLIYLKENKLMFRSNYNPLVETKNFIFVLKLPLGYIIPQEPGKEKSFFVSPEPDNLYSDGQRIILNWQKEQLDEKFEVSVISEQPDEPPNVFEIILVFLLVVIILFLFFYFKKKIKTKQKKVKVSKKKKKSKTEILEEYLVESEKKVINELRNADKKELWQKQLQLKTEFSKAKLSRVIRNLEARNIIQKIPFGNTNKIKLKIC